MCSGCGGRTSVTGGTIFDRTRTPLTARFNAGVALLSRLPLESAQIRVFGLPTHRFAIATLAADGRSLAVSVVHTASPIGASRTALHNRQLDTLSLIADEFDDREVIIVGDFNTSPWSSGFQRLLSETGWRNAAQGFGYRPTWPSHLLWLGIRIDHHIVSPGLVVQRFSTVGSVALTFHLRPAALRPLQVPTQPIVFSLKVTNRIGAIRHIEVMPDSRKKYKGKCAVWTC